MGEGKADRIEMPNKRIASCLNAPTLPAWRWPQNTKEGSEPIFGEDSFLTAIIGES